MNEQTDPQMNEKNDSSESCAYGVGAIIQAGIVTSVLAVGTITLHNKPPHNSVADQHSICFGLLMSS